MYTGNAVLDMAYTVLLGLLPILLAVMIILCLVRAIKGPRIADRIVAINMMGTLTIVTISILAVKMGQDYLVDICIIYAMISFIAVTLLTKVYMGVYAENKAKREAKDGGKLLYKGVYAGNEAKRGAKDVENLVYEGVYAGNDAGHEAKEGDELP